MKQYRLQKRQHPIFSPVALISTLLLAGGLVGWVYLAGGQAFSPGPLSAVSHGAEPLAGMTSHLDFGHKCDECHTPFQGVDNRRCERCHENIGQQRLTNQGLHSRIENVTACGICHKEHKGRDFDQFTAALLDFDHNISNFSLVKHALDYQNLPLKCDACHQNTGRNFTVVVSACANCHQPADFEFMALHSQAFGEKCLDCHDGRDTMAGFTLQAHAEVFALTGAHLTATCESCHQEGRFKDIDHACVTCHAEPQAHAGMFAQACDTCHRPEDWRPAKLEDHPFDHAFDTNFSLVKHVTTYEGEPFTCRSCHAAGQPVSFANEACVTCHAPADPGFMTAHINQFGQNCLDCHDGTGAMTHFDHSQVWPLEGQHAPLPCTACHIDQVFKGTPTACAGCHPEPDIHAGLFGATCVSCHTAQGWQPAQLTVHPFPLDHGEQGELACAACHPATYAQYTCYACHEHEPAAIERSHIEEGISLVDLPNCTQCHPTGEKTRD